MSTLLPFIVIGLTTGAVYGLAGVGLVLTYKTSGVFNFAYGALAAVAAYAFYVLHVLNGWAWPLAAVVAVLVVGPLMGLILELLARRIQGRSLALQVASTVGLLLVIEAGVNLIYGTQTVRNVPVFLGAGNFRLLGTNVQVAQLVTFLFAIAVTVALSAFFRVSRRGIAMRAVVDNPELLDIAGTSPANTRRQAWIIGCTLAAASGVLFAPLLPLDPVQLTLLVVAAGGGRVGPRSRRADGARAGAVRPGIAAGQPADASGSHRRSAPDRSGDHRVDLSGPGSAAGAPVSASWRLHAGGGAGPVDCDLHARRRARRHDRAVARAAPHPIRGRDEGAR